MAGCAWAAERRGPGGPRILAYKGCLYELRAASWGAVTTGSTARLSARTSGKTRPPRPSGARSGMAVRPRSPGVAPPGPVEPPLGSSPALPRGTGLVPYLALVTGLIPVV